MNFHESQGDDKFLAQFEKLRANRRNESIIGTITSSMASFHPTMNQFHSFHQHRSCGECRTCAVVPSSRDIKFTGTACGSGGYQKSENPLLDRAELITSLTKRSTSTGHVESQRSDLHFSSNSWSFESATTKLLEDSAAECRDWEGHEDVHVIVQWFDQAGGERVVEKWKVYGRFREENVSVPSCMSSLYTWQHMDIGYWKTFKESSVS